MTNRPFFTPPLGGNFLTKLHRAGEGGDKFHWRNSKDPVEVALQNCRCLSLVVLVAFKTQTQDHRVLATQFPKSQPQRSEIRVPVPGPPENFYGGTTSPALIIFPGNQGGQKKSIKNALQLVPVQRFDFPEPCPLW